MFDWFQVTLYLVLSVLVGLYGFLYADVKNLKEEFRNAKKNEQKN